MPRALSEPVRSPFALPTTVARTAQLLGWNTVAPRNNSSPATKLWLSNVWLVGSLSPAPTWRGLMVEFICSVRLAKSDCDPPIGKSPFAPFWL